MKLIGNLKKQVDNATDLSEKRTLIERADMALTDDELNMVAGGSAPQFMDGTTIYTDFSDSGSQITGTSCGDCRA